MSLLLLSGKRILQEIVADTKSWDEGISEKQQFAWEKWRKDLQVLDKIQIKISFKIVHFGKIFSSQIHHFSDVSEVGYGEASYLRLLDEHGLISSTHDGEIKGCTFEIFYDTTPRTDSDNGGFRGWIYAT